MKLSKPILFLPILFSGVVCASPYPHDSSEEVRIREVLSGDTFIYCWETGGGEDSECAYGKLAAVDAPKLGTCGSLASKGWLQDQIEGKTFFIQYGKEADEMWEIWFPGRLTEQSIAGGYSVGTVDFLEFLNDVAVKANVGVWKCQ